MSRPQVMAPRTVAEGEGGSLPTSEGGRARADSEAVHDGARMHDVARAHGGGGGHDGEAAHNGTPPEQRVTADDEEGCVERNLGGEAATEQQSDEDEEDGAETETEDEAEGEEGRETREAANTVWNWRTREEGRGAGVCFAEVWAIAKEVVATDCGVFSVEDVAGALRSPLEQLPFRTGAGLTYTRRQDVPDCVAACPQLDEVLKALKHIASQKDAYGCDGYAEADARNAGPPQLEAAEGPHMPQLGHLYVRLVRAYCAWLQLDSEVLLNAWQGPNECVWDAAWRATMRHERDALQKVLERQAEPPDDATQQLRSSRPTASGDESAGHTVAWCIYAPAIWAWFLVRTFFASPFLITQRTLHDRLPEDLQKLVADLSAEMIAADEAAAEHTPVVAAHAADFGGQLSTKVLADDTPVVYNFPARPTAAFGRWAEGFYAAFAGSRARGTFHRLIDPDLPGRFPREPKGTTSSTELGANGHARDLYVGLVRRMAEHGAPAVAATAAELADVPPIGRSQLYGRALLPEMKEVGRTMAKEEPAMLAHLIAALLTDAAHVKRGLPKVAEVQEQACPENGEVMRSFPPVVLCPRPIHPDLRHSQSTAFYSHVRPGASEGGARQRLCPGHELARFLPAAGELFLFNEANVRVHTDRHDGYRYRNSVVPAMFASRFLFDVRALADGAGVTFQAAGVAKGTSNRLGIRSLDLAADAARVALAMATPNGLQVFPAALVPHGSSALRLRKGFTVGGACGGGDVRAGEAVVQGYGARWRTENPEVGLRNNGLLVSPEIRVFTNGRDSQQNIDTLSACQSVKEKDGLVALVTREVAVVRRYFGLSALQKAEERWSGGKSLAGFAWTHAFLRHDINRVVPKSQPHGDERTVASKDQRAQIKRCKASLRALRAKMAPPRGYKWRRGDRLQYDARQALSPGDVIVVRRQRGVHRLVVTEVHLLEGGPPSGMVQNAPRGFKPDGYYRLYDLRPEGGATFEAKDAPTLAGVCVRLEGVEVDTERCAAPRARRANCLPSGSDGRTTAATAELDGRSVADLSEAAPPTEHDVGRRLLVYWAGDDRWYKGRLVAMGAGGVVGEAEGACRVVYDDGEDQWEALGDAVPYQWTSERLTTAPPPTVDDMRRRLAVYWAADDAWYEGRLMDVVAGHAVDKEEGDYYVKYDDGECRWEPLGDGLAFRWL